MNKLSFELWLFLVIFLFQVKFVSAMDKSKNLDKKDVIIIVDTNDQMNGPIFIPKGKVVGGKKFGEHEILKNKKNNRVKTVEEELDNLENGVCSDSYDFAKNLADIILENEMGKHYDYNDLVVICRQAITKNKCIEEEISKFCKIKSEQPKSKSRIIDGINENIQDSLEKVTQKVIKIFVDFILSENKQKDSMVKEKSIQVFIQQERADKETKRANSNRKWARGMSIVSILATSCNILAASAISAVISSSITYLLQK